MNIRIILGIMAIISFIYGMTKGHSLKDLFIKSLSGMPKTFIVIKVLILIGLMTGLWRSSGTISYFIYYGVTIISPKIFILTSFLICAFISFGIGTSFGTASTAGVVLIAIARSGGVNPMICAGAILSGIYFGDRGSPSSSAGALLSSVTDTDFMNNLKNMHKTALAPYAFCICFYLFLSFKYPLKSVSTDLLDALANESIISPFCAVPALIMIILPLLKVKIKVSMVFSIISSFLISILIENNSIIESLKYSIFGYVPRQKILSNILYGGGLVSMLNIFILLILAGILGSLIDYLGFLEKPQYILERISRKYGKLPTNIMLSFLVCMVLCNQTICIMLQEKLTHKLYSNNEELALDIANSGILIAECVPWCIAIAVPLATLNANFTAWFYAPLIYTIPIWYLITKKRPI